MNDGPVHAYFVSLWERRRDPAAFNALAKNVHLTRLLYQAINSEIEHRPAYDPELDAKVAWCREILADAKDPRRDFHRAPRASAESEGMAEYYLKLGPFAPDAIAPDDDDSFEMFPR
jgi:hypothetical protein